MTENDHRILSELSGVIDRMTSGTFREKATLSELPESEDTALNELKEKILYLNEQYGQAYRFIMDLAQGKLNTASPVRNTFASPFKQLHAELSYLTWQIQQIADGDFDQVVYFSGDFSQAINKMVVALRERQKLMVLIGEYAAELKESNATKDKLFSIIAHDLKNPFNAILGFSALLSDELQAENYEEARQYAGIIHDSTTHAFELLTNLLEWARIQSGKMVITPAPTTLNEIIEKNIDINRGSALSKSISLRFDTTDTYPVVTDASIVNTLIRNLMANAIKYTPEGGDVSVSVQKTPIGYQVTVRDTGIGIDEQNRDKIFTSNYTTPGVNNEPGSGLGLVLCKELVQLLGGCIWIEESSKSGTAIAFSIPDNVPL